MNANQNNGPVKFINAEIRQSKTTGKYYLWSRPIDLKEIMGELGSNLVTLTITTPKNARNEFQRTIVVKPAEVQNQAAQQQDRKNNGRDNYNEIPI